jgi:hypothetical protein
MAINVVVVVVRLVLTCSCPFRVPLPLVLYPRGRGYKEGNQLSYNMILIWTLSLLAYFTDIAIYVLWSMTWSSKIFRMVGRVVMDPSLNLPSIYGVVPWVPILVTSPYDPRPTAPGDPSTQRFNRSQVQFSPFSIQNSNCYL